MRTGFVLDDAHWFVVQQGLPEGLVDTQWVSSDAHEATEFVSVGGLDLVVVEASEKLLTTDLVHAADSQGIMLAALITHPGAEEWANQRGVGHRLYQPEDLVALVTGTTRPPSDHTPSNTRQAPDRGGGLPGPSRRATVRVFWGPHGAAGVSTLCVSTASVLARQGLAVCVVDADARGGVISPALGVLDPIPGFLAAIRLAGKGQLNAGHIQRLASRYVAPPTEFAILTGTPRALLPGEVPRDSLDTLLDLLRQLFDVVLIDSGSDLPLHGEDHHSAGAQMTSHLLQRADDIVAICAVSPAGVARFARAMPELETHAAGTPIRVWLNGVDTSRRAVGDEAMLREALWRFAGLGEYASLPRDTSVCVESERKALSPIDVNPQSGLAHALRHELADFVTNAQGGESAPQESKKPRFRQPTRTKVTPQIGSDGPEEGGKPRRGKPTSQAGVVRSMLTGLRRRWLELTALR